jgi:hypothetical protein
MRQIIIIGSMLLAAAVPIRAEQYDPQSVLNSLIQQHLHEDAQRRQNEATRLELEHLDLQRQLRYHRLSDRDLMAELTRYCPNGEPPCTQVPPTALLQEAAQRGIILFPNPLQSIQPGFDCITFPDDDGGGITDCR